MKEKPSLRIVFLCTRLADYFYQCIAALLDRYPDGRVTVITRRPDKDAPYVFKEATGLKIRYYEDFKDLGAMRRLIDTDRPELIYVAGWSDGRYLNLVRAYRQQIPIILGMDNPWRGTLRQWVGVLFYSRRLRKQFTQVWCPGVAQVELARRLGFTYAQILSGLYVANSQPYSRMYLARQKKKATYPRRLLFLGRFVSYKQPHVLAKVFHELVQEGANRGWTLELTGSGPLKESLKAYEGTFIQVNDFVDPAQLPEKLSSCGAFCLPSHNEHWGVVVQEAAAAGLPLLLSSTVYAGTTFLINQHNGWRFSASDPAQLRAALIELVHTSEEELIKMGANSHRLAQKISHEDWVANLLSVISR